MRVKNSIFPSQDVDGQMIAPPIGFVKEELARRANCPVVAKELVAKTSGMKFVRAWLPSRAAGLKALEGGNIKALGREFAVDRS